MNAGVQVKLWDPLRTRAIPERLRGVFTTRRYTNTRLPSPFTWSDKLQYVVFVDDLNGMGLRVRVYGGDRLRRDRLVGEKFVAFSSLDLDELEQQSQGRGQSIEKLIELEPRSNIEVSPCLLARQ